MVSFNCMEVWYEVYAYLKNQGHISVFTVPQIHESFMSSPCLQGEKNFPELFKMVHNVNNVRIN